jgi:RHS repeat-associated protein
VIAISDVNGSIVESYEYDVFGEPTIRDSGHVPRDTSAFGNRFMFTGRRYDDETGLYYYRSRYYAADIGRFLQTDPIGYYFSMNLYEYCWNNPLNWIDPWGLDVWIAHHGLSHRNINVGNPKGYYTSYSYALKGSRFNMLNPFRRGIVYKDREEGLGRIDYKNEYIKTTLGEDEIIRKGFETIEGVEGPYDLWFNNCRTFVNEAFEALKELLGNDIDIGDSKDGKKS